MKKNYFLDSNKEFIIEDMYPRRPLLNYLWNDSCIAELDQFCYGYTTTCINKQFRNVVNNVRLVYIKDRDSGQVFDINRNIRKLPYEKHFCRVGLGYQTVESCYDGVYGTYTIVIPETGNIEIQKITIKNISDKIRRVSVYPYVNPTIHLEGHLAYGKAYYDQGFGGLYYYYHAFGETDSYKESFFKCSEKIVGYCTNSTDFIGTYNGYEEPIAIKEEKLCSKNSTFINNYCVAVQIDIQLQPGEEKEIYCAVGVCQNYAEVTAVASKYATKEAFDVEYEKQIQGNLSYIDKFIVNTPDEYINSTVNIWLKRQISLGKTWGRIYNKGFRDLLQDITGFVSFDREKARERILSTLKYQYISGNAVRSYDPINTHPYQDMPSWIPMAVLAYLKEYNDFSILEEKVGYYDDDRYESVLMHIKRGIDYLYLNQGQRGLCLWVGGDWNDSINNCGMLMKGESVWLSIAAIKATNDYIEIIQRLPAHEKEDSISDLCEKREKLKSNIIEYGFEKDHFIYGINDWDEKVGSYDCEEGKMYLNPQTWAVIAELFDYEKSSALMDHVENNLKCDYGYMQNVPAYTKPDEHIGRVTYFGPGLYENGSVYNHGVMFKVVADCMLKRGDLAYETLKMVRYDNPKNPNSGTEPYAISNMYLGPNAFANKGYAPYSWITGSAAWLYRAITEFMLGIKADYDGLIIDPSLPSNWDNIAVERLFQGVKYVISYKRGGEKGIIADGKKIEGNKIPVHEKGSTHVIEVIL